MNNDQFAGGARYAGGKVEEKIGDFTGDRDLQGDGLIDQVKGRAQTLYGDAKEAVTNIYDRAAPATRDGVERAMQVTRQNSLLAMLAAGAVGYALARTFQGSNNSRDY